MSFQGVTFAPGFAKYIAGLLLVATVFSVASFSFPHRAEAQIFPSQCLASALGSLGSLLGLVGGSGSVTTTLPGLFVPVLDSANLSQNTTTAGATGQLNQKSCLDALMTSVLKAAISLVRDMVIRWIITGRFEGPVFSTSFMIDAARTAENASRIFLSQLTGINFCSSLSPPSLRSFGLNANFGLDCSLPSNLNSQYNSALATLATNPRALSLEESEALVAPENLAIPNYVTLMDHRERTIAKALVARSAEYVAGQGFLGIRDANGRIVTPGSTVAKLVMESQIVSPIRQTDVADDVQTAIASIIDVAIRTLVEKGLASASGS